jgi:hypothetical protein
MKACSSARWLSSRSPPALAPASSRFSATVMPGASVKCWYTMPMPSVRAPRWGWNVLLAPVDQDAAFFGALKARHAFDQRALAGAVFAQQRVHGAGGAPSHGHVVQRGEAPKRLVRS